MSRSSSLQENVLTTHHLTVFGGIIVSWARLEMKLGSCISAVLKCPLEQSMLVTAGLPYPKKRDLMTVLSDGAEWPAEQKTKAKDILSRMDTLSKTRDLIAHAIWVKGRAKDTIKPMKLKANGVIKFLGLHHNEQEFTAAFFRKTLQDIDSLSNELSDFVLDQLSAEDRAWYTQATSNSASPSEASDPPR